LGDCVLKEDISFYNGSGGIDNGLKLLFDAYLPPSTRNLPGANSTIIRIHGGGWTVGDKGTGNMPLMNRYFATQGYCVFDIQYGLNNQSNILPFAESITPQTVKGNFSINDMVRHVGIFCQYLVTHQSEYPANLSSVFISGGSAGGHLTCITALAIASGNYTSLFGPGITIKGYVPFYPANDLANFIDGGISNKEFYDPTLLISASSPPCLVYQGNQDGLVNPKTAQDLKDQYSNHENPSCMVIFLPFAGHGSDIDFYGYYNQFFLYYMERFLYLYR
jgi:acetyl esterase/lipase